MLRRVLLQRLLMGGFAVVLVLAAIRLLAFQGWFAPARIISGSMAERFLGEHYAGVCGDCGFPFRFGLDSLPPLSQATCPNCGYERNPIHREGRQRGSRVLIDHGAYWFGSPQRFDVVAFRDSQRPDRLIVKRVVALPGERIAIRAGELFVDGRLLRKSTAEFRQLSVVVHDNHHLPTRSHDMPLRWQADRNSTGWHADGGSFLFEPIRSPKAVEHQEQHSDNGVDDQGDWEQLDWIRYHHWRCYASPYSRTAEAPISDNCGYNQAESRELRSVTDVVLRCRISSRGPGELVLRVHDGREWFELRISPEGHSIRISRTQVVIAATALPGAPNANDFELEFGILDGQVVVAVDRQELVRREYETAKGELRPIARAVAIGTESLDCAVRDIVILRDVYYLDPYSVGSEWELKAPVGNDEYFMLGDNPSLSEDGRQWTNSTVRRDAFLGPVLPWPW